MFAGQGASADTSADGGIRAEEPSGLLRAAVVERQRGGELEALRRLEQLAGGSDSNEPEWPLRTTSQVLEAALGR